jgi:hypothetical protein
MLAHLPPNKPLTTQPPLSKYMDEHAAQRSATKKAIADKHRVRIALATEPYSPYNTLNS